MFRPADQTTCATIVFLAALALVVAGRAQAWGEAVETQRAPKKSAAALKAEETYKTTCQVCHLADGKGLTPDMSFTDGQWKHGATVEALAKTIREGVKGTLMLPFKDKLSDAEIVELAKLVKAFGPKKPAAKKRPQARASLRATRLQPAGAGAGLREREP